MAPTDSTGTPSSGSGEGADNGADTGSGEDLEGTDQEVNWEEEGNQIVADQAGEDVPAKGDETPAPDKKQEELPQKKQDDKQAPAPGDKKQEPSDEEKRLAEEAKQKAAGEDDKSKQQTPAPEKKEAQETPEAKQAREQKQAEDAAKEHTKLVEYYKLPDDQAARLATEPEVVLPELAARLHVAVQNGVQAWAARVVPQIMLHAREHEKANEESKAAFYGRWPELQGKEEQVLQVGAMFRQMNPKATPEEALEKVGQLVCAALGITPSAKPNGQGQPHQQQQPRTVVQQRPPVRPAGASSSQAGNAPVGDNPWEQEAATMVDEDRQS